MISNIIRFFIRVSAFLRKEIVEILRQPRLVLTLVLGPFLILFLFGIGYRVEAQPIRTLFVMEEDNPFRSSLQEYATSISPLLHFAGISHSLPAAEEELRRGNIDLIVVVPEDPVQKVRNSQQAVFQLYHDEIDPFQVDYFQAFARIYIDEVNRRVLTEIAREGQAETASVKETVSTTRQSATEMRQALEAGNEARAMDRRDDLIQGVNVLNLMVGGSAQLVAGMEQRFGSGNNSASDLSQQLSMVNEETAGLSSMQEGQDDYTEEIERAQRIEEQFSTLETTLTEFQSVEPAVLVSPFRAEVASISEVPLRLSDFYVPSAIVLLAQHLAVTFAALSIVREQHEGTMEVFQVSPLTPIEALLGKYISYFIFIGVLLVILTALSLYAIQVPMLGNWALYAFVVAALIFTSLGFGFVLSLLAETTTQAVQYSMIILLASIFFSGFFLALQLLRPFVQVVSWMLPATYATQMLQDVMLRGTFSSDNLLLLVTLLAMGLAFFVLAWLMLRRKMTRR